MDITGIREFLFRHVEKIVLAAVIAFVGYRVYLNLSSVPGGVVQSDQSRPKPPTATMPGRELGASFWRTTSPFLRVPPIERAKYNWFYPPRTTWGRYVMLQEGKPGKDTARVFVRGKVISSPQVTELTEAERIISMTPTADKDLTTVCQISVAVTPAAPREPPGHVLVIKAIKAGFWARVMVVLEENQDRFCVAVLVSPPGIDIESGLAVARIEEIKEQPLGTVVIRFNAPRGSSRSGDKVINYIEPTYFEVRRKGERDKEESVVGRLPGRTPQGAAPGPGVEVGPLPRPADTTGFPGSPKKAPPPPKRAAVAPSKGAPPEDTGEMIFEDQDVEAEAKYTYRIRSVRIPMEGEDLKQEEKERDGDPVTYLTLPRFTFAYIGGDAQRATIRVFIGPREEPQGWKDFERIPIGGWVGDVPKEFRGTTVSAEESGPGPAKAAPAPAKAKGAAPPLEPGEGPASRFVTRHTLVAIEQGVFRPVEQQLRVPAGPNALGKAMFQVIKTFRESEGRRAIIRDPKNRLRYLWLEEHLAAPTEKEKGK